MSIPSRNTIEQAVIDIGRAPLDHPDIIPSLLPIVVGGVLIELYFGKFSNERLGWNTSVGNAVIWLSTGLGLVFTESLSEMERYAAYFLIGIGSFVGYMDFTHKWSSTTAFLVSGSGIVYAIAYVIVVLVKTPIEVNLTTMKASAIFVALTIIGFKFIQFFENPRNGVSPY